MFALVSSLASAQNNFKVPKFEKFQLPNGLTIYLMEQHEVPLINVSAVFDAGSVYDGQTYGLASMTADALMFGTKKYSKSEIEEIADFAGAEIGTYAGKESAGLSASFGTKDQDKLFDIIQQVLMFPVFDNVEYEKHKQRTLLELSQVKESPRAVIRNYFNSFAFNAFPYATPNGGTKTTVEKISSQNCREYYESQYTTGKGAIVVVGDFKTPDMKKKITGLFGAWKTKSARMYKRQAPNLEFEKSRVLLVNKEDANETTFLIGGKGIDYNSPITFL